MGTTTGGNGLLAWVDDGLVPVADARVSVFDRGFRTGEGVFETLRSYGGHVFRLDAHLNRAYEGAAFLGFDPPPRDAVAHAVRATAHANLGACPDGDAALRLTLTPGALDATGSWPLGPATDARPTVVVSAHPLPGRAAPSAGVTAVTVPLGRELPHVKALSYLAASLARATAREQGADEALLADTDGNVLEGAGSNVFAIRGGTLVTPPVTAGILAGVTRQVVLEVAGSLGIPVEERPLPLDDLVTADEAILTATTRGVMPLVRVGGQPIGDGRPGPVTARLQAGYQAEVDREVAASGA